VSNCDRRYIKAVRERGVKVAIATGRSPQAAARYYDLISSNLPLIAHNGALIVNPKTQGIYIRKTIPTNIALDLWETLPLFNRHRELSILCYAGDRVFAASHHLLNLVYRWYLGENVTPVSSLREALGDDKVICFHIASLNSSLLDDIARTLKQWYPANQAYITKCSPHILGIYQAEVNKGLAVKFVAEQLAGLSARDVMAIGNDSNDLSMLEYAGIGVAIDTAPPRVRAKAQLVVSSVAQALERVLQGDKNSHLDGQNILGDRGVIGAGIPQTEC